MILCSSLFLSDLATERIFLTELSNDKYDLICLNFLKAFGLVNKHKMFGIACFVIDCVESFLSLQNFQAVVNSSLSKIYINCTSLAPALSNFPVRQPSCRWPPLSPLNHTLQSGRRTVAVSPPYGSLLPLNTSHHPITYSTTSKPKGLGIILNTVHSADNVACTAITVHKMLLYLKQLFAALIPNVLLLLYKVFIPPHFEYAN